jgi:site-specific recombinase XerD
MEAISAGPITGEGDERTALGVPSLSGAPLEERNLRHVLKRMLEKAELRQLRIHDLRHTFASLLLQQGESVV